MNRFLIIICLLQVAAHAAPPNPHLIFEQQISALSSFLSARDNTPTSTSTPTPSVSLESNTVTIFTTSAPVLAVPITEFNARTPFLPITETDSTPDLTPAATTTRALSPTNRLHRMMLRAGNGHHDFSKRFLRLKRVVASIGTVYPDSHSQSSTLSPSAYITLPSSMKSTLRATNSNSTLNSTSTKILRGEPYAGVSSYYLFALEDGPRIEVLDAISSGGFKVIRIFVTSVDSKNKGSDSRYMNDVEPNTVGVYDTTILLRIDQLMVECQARGLKLMIALHDRYALGFWSTDAYAVKYQIVPPRSSDVQKVTAAENFYDKGTSDFDNRMAFILNHRNNLLGGKKWIELDDVIFALEAQNEPQGYMTAPANNWACDRSAYLRTLLNLSSSSIQISSGGGITLPLSLGEWAMNCTAIDIVSVHDYGTDFNSIVDTIVAKSRSTGREIILGEWGIQGEDKPSIVAGYVSKLKAARVSWLYWQVVAPGKGRSDFEIWHDEPAWASLISHKTLPLNRSLVQD